MEIVSHLFRKVSIFLLVCFMSVAVSYAQNVSPVLSPAEASSAGKLEAVSDPATVARLPLYAKNGWSVLGLGGGGATFNPSFSPFVPGLVLLGTDMGVAFRSEDSGQHWELIHQENNLRFLQFATKPVYFAKRIYWQRGLSPMLVFSEDNGRNWEVVKDVPWQKAKILALAGVPGSHDVLLVGTEGGLWRTENHGQKWSKVADGPVSHLHAMADVIYAIQQERQLLVSKDLGVSWVTKDGLQQFGAAKALTGGGHESARVLFASLDPSGLVRSFDDGDTWEIIKTPYEKETVLVMQGDQSRQIYAAQTGTTQNKILRSDDQGKTWSSVFNMGSTGGFRAVNSNVEVSWVQTKLSWGYYVTQNGLAIDPLNSSRLIVTTVGDIYRSDNGGESWRQLMTEHLRPSGGGGELFNKSVGLEVTSAWGYTIDPHNPSFHYISYTDIGFARSVDSGVSWTWSAKGSPWTNTYYDVATDSGIPGRLYAAASQLHDIPYDTYLGQITASYALHKKGGVVLSDDYGKTWSVPYKSGSSESLPAQVCTTIAIDEASPVSRRVMYAGIFGEGDDDAAGVYKSVDGGGTWTKKSQGLGTLQKESGLRNLHIYRLRIHPKSGHIYCLITGLKGSTKDTLYKIPGGLWKSTDGGDSWQDISQGQDLAWQATDFCFDPKSEDIIYVSAASPPGRWRVGGIFRTDDGGKEWDRIFPVKPTIDEAGYDVMSVHVHPENSQMIYAGDESGLYYSADSGKNWKYYKEFPGRPVQDIVFVPGNTSAMIVTTFGTGVWLGPTQPINIK